MGIEISFVSKTGNSALTGSDLHDMDQRRYIDPGNYLDLMELLSTFTSEIERDKTKLEGQIGQGKCHLLLLLSNTRLTLGVLSAESQNRKPVDGTWLRKSFASSLPHIVFLHSGV